MPPETTVESQRPVPVPDEASAPFFAGRSERRARCSSAAARAARSCGRSSPAASSASPARSSGRQRAGAPSSTASSVVHQRYPGFEEPYVIATVETPEGVRFNTSIVGVDRDELEIGMPLEVVFEPVSDDVVVPKFRPAS